MSDKTPKEPKDPPRRPAPPEEPPRRPAQPEKPPPPFDPDYSLITTIEKGADKKEHRRRKAR